MIFGSNGVFHRQLENEVQPLFSMANIANPGTFNKDEWNTFETRGVTMFLALPGPLGALDAWDAMLATSRRMVGPLTPARSANFATVSSPAKG